MKPVRLMVLADKGVVVAEMKPNNTMEGNDMFGKKKITLDPAIVEMDKKAMKAGKDGYTILMDSLMEKMGRVEKQVDMIPEAHQADVINSIKLFYSIKDFADTLHRQMKANSKHDVVTATVLDSMLTILSLCLGEFAKGPSCISDASDNFFTMLTGATPDEAHNVVRKAFGGDIDLIDGSGKPDGPLH
jgi:hypothetical protein